MASDFKTSFVKEKVQKGAAVVERWSRPEQDVLKLNIDGAFF